jgi:hypothetical protein
MFIEIRGHHVHPRPPLPKAAVPRYRQTATQEEEVKSVLNLHSGGHVVTRQQLAAYEAPPPTETWKPHSHIGTLQLVEKTLAEAGYRIAEQRLAVHMDGKRFFSVMDLETPIVPGLTLAIGLRNSYDKSFPYGLVGGSRTFVCSNLSFSGTLINVRRKHSKNGQIRFQEATALAISNLAQFRQIEQQRIEFYQTTPLDPANASHLILQAYRRDIISSRLLDRVIHEYEEPSHDFGPPTLYRLMQAFTTVLTERVNTAPQVFAAQTIALTGLLGNPPGFDSPELIIPNDATASPATNA